MMTTKFLYINFVVALWLTAGTTLFLGIFVLLRNSKQIINRTFAFYSFSIAWWSFCQIWLIACDKKITALIWTRIEQVGVFFIPTFFVHFVISLLNIKHKKWLIRTIYVISIGFAFLCPTSLMMADAVPKETIKYVKYFATPGLAYHFAILFFVILVIYGLFKLYKAYRLATGSRSNQLKYLFWSSLFGYSGGAANFLLVYGISIPILNPFGTYCLPIYIIIVAYAILRYRLMDINIALTRAGIFSVVYAFILGIPFWLGYITKLWLPSTILAVLLATIGPFIYLYLQRRTEDIILKKQRRYQEILRKAAKGMILIKNPAKLQKLIVHILTKTIPIAYAGIYLYDEKDEYFVLKANRGNRPYNVIEKLNKNSPIIEYLFKMKKPVFIEDLKNANSLKRLEKNIVNEAINIARNMNAILIIPSFIEDEMMGFLVLGDKISGHSYTDDDLSVLSVLTNQAALAIENAQFYEKSSKEIADRSEQKGIDKTSIGAAHQMKNILARLAAGAKFVDTAIKVTESKEITFEKAQSLLSLTKNNMQEILKEAEKGKRMLDTILYPAKVKEDFAELNVYALVKQALESSSRTKSKDILERNIPAPIVTNDIPESFPRIIGNESLVEQILENLINNAFDAILWRYSYLKPDNSYRGKITITAKDKDDNVAISIEDNGIGMEAEVKEKLFAGYFTTKSAEHKGDGAGLYSMKKWIEQHKGNISFVSEYGKGTTFTVELPKEQEGFNNGSKTVNS